MTKNNPPVMTKINALIFYKLIEATGVRTCGIKTSGDQISRIYAIDTVRLAHVSTSVLIGLIPGLIWRPDIGDVGEALQTQGSDYQTFI